jgi:hypothetical protein
MASIQIARFDRGKATVEIEHLLGLVTGVRVVNNGEGGIWVHLATVQGRNVMRRTFKPGSDITVSLVGRSLPMIFDGLELIEGPMVQTSYPT